MATDTKILTINLSSLALIGLGFVIPLYGDVAKTAGYFALSGALTNWLALHMLFEHVPFLYGSGVITLHGPEFKKSINHLVMKKFFTEEAIQQFFEKNIKNVKGKTSVDQLVSGVDFDLIYARLVETILDSKVGGMISFVGGKKLFTPLKEPMIKKLHLTIREIINSEQFHNALIQGNACKETRQTIQNMVDERLEELTPYMVKNIIKNMFKKHLGWLVVWGGIFDGLIGVIFYFLHWVP